jgi:hypothetical protein
LIFLHLGDCIGDINAFQSGCFGLLARFLDKGVERIQAGLG